jgi:hypothetical protein
MPFDLIHWHQAIQMDKMKIILCFVSYITNLYLLAHFIIVRSYGFHQMYHYQKDGSSSAFDLNK